MLIEFIWLRMRYTLYSTELLAVLVRSRYSNVSNVAHVSNVRQIVSMNNKIMKHFKSTERLYDCVKNGNE
jgi:hypothetical protein